MVRSDDNVKKLRICDYDFLLSAYADDTTFFVKDIDSISKIFILFDEFSLFSGFKLNVSKCEVCGIGALKGVNTALCNVKNINLTSDSIRVLGIHFSYDSRIREEKNFTGTIKKICNVLKVWKMRNLTLIGKIVIFKSLAISKIISTSYMSSVPTTVLNNLVTIHKDFIWDGKKPKIKHSTLIANYSYGGLKDIDIPSKIRALQLSWLKRLLDDSFHPWKVIPLHFLSKLTVLGENIFFPNLSFNIQHALPTFYSNILTSWMDFSQAIPITASSILSQSIWYNSLIRIANDIITPTFLCCRKQVFVSDFFDRHGNVRSWDNFSTSYNLSPALFFRWLQIVDALPKHWIKVLKEDAGRSRLFCDFSPHAILKAKIFPMSKLNSRTIYDHIIAAITKPPTSIRYFLRYFQVESLPWKDIFLLPRFISIDSYSRFFQYKILNNMLFLNLPLFRMGLSDTPLCSYCREHDETIQHLFVNCDISKVLWCDLQNLLANTITLPDLDSQSAVFGFLDSPAINFLIVNNVLLMFKISLYINRDKHTLSLRRVLANLKKREIIERSLVFSNPNKLNFHQNKWSSILPFL